MYEDMRDSFIEGLSGFYSNEEMPPHASINMRRALIEHKKRLDKKGITFIERFTPSKEPRAAEHRLTTQAFYSTDASYHCDTVVELTDGQTSIKCDEARDDVVHLQVIDRNETSGQDDSDILLVCPNCGEHADAATFATGCPMCGTRFKMNELYPCVNTYYYRPYPLPPQTDKNMFKRAGIGLAGGIVIGVMFAISTVVEMVKYERYKPIALVMRPIISALFGVFIGFLVCYAIVTIIFGIRTVRGSIKVAADTYDMTSAITSKMNAEKAMNPYDPQFVFEVFEGKILSAIRTIAYSDNRLNCSLYCGEDDLSFMDDLVDIRYRGATKFMKSTVEDGYVHILTTVYLDNIYYRDGNFIRSREDFLVELVRHESVHTSPLFTAYSISCKGCGASFDSVVSRTCPYCGAKYEYNDHDWSIIRLARRTKNAEAQETSQDQ